MVVGCIPEWQDKIILCRSTPKSSEVNLFSRKEIPWGEIAFRVIDKTLQIYFNDKQSGKFDFQIQEIEAHYD
jgi:hypothetical protein